MASGRLLPDDLLFVQPWVCRWGPFFEFSVASCSVGDRAGSLRAFDRLLAPPGLPDACRRQTPVAREFAVAGRAAGPRPLDAERQGVAS
jgi:hypothetical protein